MLIFLNLVSRQDGLKSGIQLAEVDHCQTGSAIGQHGKVERLGQRLSGQIKQLQPEDAGRNPVVQGHFIAARAVSRRQTGKPKRVHTLPGHIADHRNDDTVQRAAFLVEHLTGHTHPAAGWLGMGKRRGKDGRLL